VAIGEPDKTDRSLLPERLPIGVQMERCDVLVYPVANPIPGPVSRLRTPCSRGSLAAGEDLRIEVPSHIRKLGRQGKQTVLNQLLTEQRYGHFSPLVNEI
jgi:hypothetical protein